jgi:ribosomal protein L13
MSGSATRQNNNQNQRTNLCKVITKKAIREFLPNTERGRDMTQRHTNPYKATLRVLHKISESHSYVSTANKSTEEIQSLPGV